MMIGLLQSGTGIGRGMSFPMTSKGLLDAARGCKASVRTADGAICSETTSAAPPLESGPAARWLP